MTTPQLPFEFTPISMDYVKSAKAAGQIIGYNADLKHLWHVLMLGGGWGTAAKQPVLADLLYEVVPTTPHQNERPSSNPLRNKKGVRRFEDILRGKDPITQREAEAFHSALSVAFGSEWAKKISKERLVMMSMREFFGQIEINSLPWPNTLYSINGIKALLEILPDQNLFISPAFDNASRAGYVTGSTNQNLVSFDYVPIYKEGSKFDLYVDGIASDFTYCCVLELCPDGLKMPGKDEIFYILPYAAIPSPGAQVKLNGNGESFRVGQAKGRFEFVAIAIKSMQSPLLKYFADYDDSPFNAAKTREFAATLVSEALSGNDHCRVAKYAYQVF